MEGSWTRLVRCPWLVCALALAAAVSFAPRAAYADDAETAKKTAEAREHYQKGITHYNLGEFDQAIDEFKQAYAISGSPGLLFNVAQAYRLKKDYENALYFYRTYLRLQPDASNRPDVEARIIEMEKLLIEQKALDKAKPTGTIPPDDVKQPDATQPDAKQPDVTQPDARQPDATQPDAKQPDGRSVAHAGDGHAADDAGRDLGAGAPIITAQRHAPSPLAGLVRFDASLTASTPGVDVLLGASYDVLGFLDVAGAVVIGGGQAGAWIGGTAYLLHGKLRPCVMLGAPMFFVDGFRPGLQVGGGARWQLNPRLAFALQLSVVTFASVPSGYASTVFVPTLGFQGRL